MRELPLQPYVLIDGKLQQAWKISTEDDPYVYGRGVHTSAAADVDGDGFDEYITGAMASIRTAPSFGRWIPIRQAPDLHGDALHIAAMLPQTTNLQVMQPYEAKNSTYDFTVTDGVSGSIVFGDRKSGSYDTGRGCAANITPNPGYEVWAHRPNSENPDQKRSGSIFSADGKVLVEEKPMNFLCNWSAYWDGRPARRTAGRSGSDGCQRRYCPDRL